MQPPLLRQPERRGPACNKVEVGQQREGSTVMRFDGVWVDELSIQPQSLGIFGITLREEGTAVKEEKQREVDTQPVGLLSLGD